MAVASSIALGALVAGATAGGAVASGAIQSRAAGKAADAQTQASNYAAEQQAKSAREALAFQRQQAHQDFLNAQNAQRGNYDQWAARQGRLSTLGQMVGSKPFVIPAYVPMQEAPEAGTPPAGLPPSGNPNVTTFGQAFLRQPNGPSRLVRRPVMT